MSKLTCTFQCPDTGLEVLAILDRGRLSFDLADEDDAREVHQANEQTIRTTKEWVKDANRSAVGTRYSPQTALVFMKRRDVDVAGWD